MAIKPIPLDYYTEKLQADYQKDLLEKILHCLINKGFDISTVEEMEHLFKERMKRTVNEGLTTWSLDGIELCVSGELIVKPTKKKNNYTTSFKFVEL